MSEKIIEGEIVQASPVIDQALANFSPQDAAIAALREKYLPLRVDDIKDEKAVAIVHAARMEIRGYRVKIEKTRKDLKADALEYGRRVDGEAKRLTAQLEEIESHLEREEGRVEAERNRVKAEAEAEKKRRLDARIHVLEGLGVAMAIFQIESMSDEEFSARIEAAKLARTERLRREEEAKAAREAEEKRLAEERAKLEAAQKAERDRVAAEEARIAEERRKVEEAKRSEEARIAEEHRKLEEARRAEEARAAAERKKIEDERRAVEEEKRRQEHEKALEVARQEAAEKARREAAEKAEREQREKELAIIRDREEAARLERLKPDIEKLRAFSRLLHDIEIPEFSDVDTAHKVRKATGTAGDMVFEIAKDLEGK